MTWVMLDQNVLDPGEQVCSANRVYAQGEKSWPRWTIQFSRVSQESQEWEMSIFGQLYEHARAVNRTGWPSELLGPILATGLWVQELVGAHFMNLEHVMVGERFPLVKEALEPKTPDLQQRSGDGH
jgi:hypothetical protein